VVAGPEALPARPGPRTGPPTKTSPPPGRSRRALQLDSRGLDTGTSEPKAAVGTCDICAANAAFDAGADPWGVARLQTGYVRLNPNQYFAGSTFFVAKDCLAELHDLDRPTRLLHLDEMAEVAAAVWGVFAPRKLNYEALGNGAPHLHWWLTPRYADDARPRAPIWEDLEFLRAQWTNSQEPSPDLRDQRRRDLLVALRRRDVTIEVEPLGQWLPPTSPLY